MTDYKKAIPSQSGSYQMIRDLGSTVEFWVISGSSLTWSQSFPWSYTVNGGTVNKTGSYPQGGSWVKLGQTIVSYSQNVTFTLGNTGTVGLGSGQSFTVYLERGVVRVRVNGVWQMAQAYVRTGGVWKPAQPYVRVSGTWKPAG